MKARLNWRPATADDVDVCDSIGTVTEHQRLLASMTTARLPAVAFTRNGQALAVVGVHLAQDRGRAVLRVWAFISPLALKHHATAFALGLRRLLVKMGSLAGIDAIETWVDPARPRALYLLDRLGFTFEREFVNPYYPHQLTWRMSWTRS